MQKTFICIARPKSAPLPALCFVTHISICHSFLGPQEARLYPFRMVCRMAMGLRWDVWGVGDSGLWGVGGRVQSDRVPPLLSSTQILFSFFAQNKTQDNIYLVFYAG